MGTTKGLERQVRPSLVHLCVVAIIAEVAVSEGGATE